MADQTIIAKMALSGIQPRELHAGLNTVLSIYSLSRTLSASDKIYMCKIPDGARITDIKLTSNVNLFADAGILNVGTPDSAARFIASVTPSQNLVFTINVADGLGYLNDISDAAETRYTYIQVSCSTAKTGTTSGAISLLVQYMMDQPSTS